MEVAGGNIALKVDVVVVVDPPPSLRLRGTDLTPLLGAGPVPPPTGREVPRPLRGPPRDPLV